MGEERPGWSLGPHWPVPSNGHAGKPGPDPAASIRAPGTRGPTKAQPKKRVRGRPGVVVAVVVAAIVTVGGIAWLSTGTSSTTGSTTGSTKTPQSTASTIVAVFKSGNLTQICTLTSSSEKARCRADFRPITGTVTYEHLALRSVYTQGDRALVVMTGGICPSSGTCQSSRSFRAATGSGGSFDQGYADATGPPSSSSPFIVPLVRQDGKWLVTGF